MACWLASPFTVGGGSWPGRRVCTPGDDDGGRGWRRLRLWRWLVGRGGRFLGCHLAPYLVVGHGVGPGVARFHAETLAVHADHTAQAASIRHEVAGGKVGSGPALPDGRFEGGQVVVPVVDFFGEFGGALGEAGVP